MIYTTTYQSPLGVLMLASDGHNLIGLWNNNQKYHGQTLLVKPLVKDDLPIFILVKNWLDRYFNHESPQINELPLLPINNSEFRQKVWQILCEIPYGETITYGDIAKRVAVQMNKEKMSAQAVGGAVGHNPISIIVPCHRVMGNNNNLTGYAGGLDKKIWLLKHEGIEDKHLIRPTKGTAL